MFGCLVFVVLPHLLVDWCSTVDVFGCLVFVVLPHLLVDSGVRLLICLAVWCLLCFLICLLTLVFDC